MARVMSEAFGNVNYVGTYLFAVYIERYRRTKNVSDSSSCDFPYLTLCEYAFIAIMNIVKDGRRCAFPYI